MKKVIKPQPGGQTNFLSRDEFEVLFGGAAGPGKSWALVIDALGLQFKDIIGKYAIEISKYRAVLFRRKTPQLADLIDECYEYYSMFGAVYKGQAKGEPGASFTFPSGARIYLCHMHEEKDKHNHQGFEYQFVGFDELSQFFYSQYIYLFSRCRSTIPGLFPRIRSTTNPIGVGLAWVLNRFQPDIEPGKVRYFIPNLLDEKDTRGIEVMKGIPESLPRVFIPGKLTENKILLERDPDYPTRIKAMGKKMADALLFSNWRAVQGQHFTWDSDVHIIREENYLSYTDIRSFEVIMGMDYGVVTVLECWYKDYHENAALFDELYMEGLRREEKIRRVKEFLEQRLLGRYIIVADTNMWIPDAFDKASQLSPAQEFLNAGIRIVPVSKRSPDKNKPYRYASNEAFNNALYYEKDEKGMLIKQPKIKVYSRCRHFIRTFPLLMTDENNPEDIATGQEDHCYDAAKYGFMELRMPRITAPEMPKWLKRLNRQKLKKGFYAS